MTDWANPAAWYDVLNPWGPSDGFYLDLVMAGHAFQELTGDDQLRRSLRRSAPRSATAAASRSRPAITIARRA